MALPSTATRHMINRFSYGYTTSQHKAVTQAGGSRAWFNAQLEPGKVSDTKADALAAWFPYLTSSPAQRFAADQSGRRGSWELGMDVIRWTLLRRMVSKRQVFEQLVDFWSNLLHVPAYDDGWMFRRDYDATIRKHALGSFADLLVAASLHPSMGVYLNSSESTRDAVNENHGRELLELHTVGLDAGYTEAMVKSSARILTGYHVDTWDTIGRRYEPDDHYLGRVSVLGFTAANTDPDGRKVMQAYLRYLAAHPATAHKLATRLCHRFVSDSPSASIVNAVAKAYTTSKTDIRATLRALVGHRDFANSVDAKTRTPALDAVATYRALGVKVAKPKHDGDFGFAVNYVLGDMGESPFMWPAPNGFPEPEAAWASYGRLRNSWEMHMSSVGGWWPSTGMSRPAPREYLPTGPMRFDHAVDAVARRLLGRPATKACIAAAAELTDTPATATIRSRDDFGDWRSVLLLTTVLNSPEHLRR